MLANPPFGGKERKEVQQPFDIKTSETAFLFLEHFIRYMKTGGRAAIVIKNTFLSNTDNASVSLRKYLLETCNLHTVLDMPSGTFLGAGVKTVVLFFTKGEPTFSSTSSPTAVAEPVDGSVAEPVEASTANASGPSTSSGTGSIWYYQLDPGRNMGKTNPLNDKDLEEFVRLSTLRRSKGMGEETEKSWNIPVIASDEGTKQSPSEQNGYDLSVKNPNTPEEAPLRAPQQILTEMEALDKQTQQLLDCIKELI